MGVAVRLYLGKPGVFDDGPANRCGSEREFDYTAGAEESLEQANREGWTVVSIKNDWATVFPDA